MVPRGIVDYNKFNRFKSILEKVLVLPTPTKNVTKRESKKAMKAYRKTLDKTLLFTLSKTKTVNRAYKEARWALKS